MRAGSRISTCKKEGGMKGERGKAREGKERGRKNEKERGKRVRWGREREGEGEITQGVKRVE